MGFGGALRRRLPLVLEVAEEGFEDEHASFEFPASRAVGSRRGGRGVHDRSMPESKRKRKVNGDGVNGYLKSYLKATGLKVGLLLNFNAPTVAIKRVVL